MQSSKPLQIFKPFEAKQSVASYLFVWPSSQDLRSSLNRFFPFVAFAKLKGGLKLFVHVQLKIGKEKEKEEKWFGIEVSETLVVLLSLTFAVFNVILNGKSFLITSFHIWF